SEVLTRLSISFSRRLLLCASSSARARNRCASPVTKARRKERKSATTMARRMPCMPVSQPTRAMQPMTIITAAADLTTGFFMDAPHLSAQFRFFPQSEWPISMGQSVPHAAVIARTWESGQALRHGFLTLYEGHTVAETWVVGISKTLALPLSPVHLPQLQNPPVIGSGPPATPVPCSRACHSS